MSGFIGIISSPLQESDITLLDVSTRAISSCCSDYLGAWNSSQADLRFGWLKTCEDTAIEQLPFTVDGNLRIVGDIRLDKRVDLVKALGVYYSAISNTTPDSYLVLYAYKQWGEDCLQHISGDYAFAIWNEETGCLFCARDHFGLIPFYYTQFDNRLLFTNFYQSLKNIAQRQPELDDDVLRDYLTSGKGWSFDQTIYKQIKKLPPAHKLTYNNGEIHISCYWNIPANIKPVRYKTTKEYVSHFHRLFEQSVKDRTRTNKVACTLSGGMDSSSITATAKKVLNDEYGDNHTLKAFNISYRHLVTEKEGYFGKLTAHHLKIPIQQYIAEDYVKNVVQPISSWIPEPVAIPDALAEAQIIIDAATFTRVLLTGFGGDPLFEYEPLSRRGLIAQGYLLQPYLDDLTFYKTFGGFFGVVRRKLGKRKKKAPATNMSVPPWFDPTFFPKDYTPIKPNKDGSSIRSNFAMSGNAFWSWLFESSHPGFTGNKMKIRQPFFSLELFLFILALPPHLLHQKSLLRMAMIPYLPKEIVRRPKTPLYGNAHSQNLKTQDIRNIVEEKISESGDFLKGKIDIDCLLTAIRDPECSSALYNNILSVLHVMSWRSSLS